MLSFKDEVEAKMIEILNLFTDFIIQKYVIWVNFEVKSFLQ